MMTAGKPEIFHSRSPQLSNATSHLLKSLSGINFQDNVAKYSVLLRFNYLTANRYLPQSTSQITGLR